VRQELALLRYLLWVSQALLALPQERSASRQERVQVLLEAELELVARQ
jgi:hypothetical protein